MTDLKLVGVIDEDPFSPQTWSGISKYLFGAFRDRGVLQAAVSAEPSSLTRYLYKALSVQSNMASWRFKYSLHLGLYRSMTATARRQLAAFDPHGYDVILQIGAWYDMTGKHGKRVVSYHDGNLATLLASPYGHPPVSRRWIQRALDYERGLYGRLDLIMPMSHWLAGSFMRDNGIPSKKIVPVGAGINLPTIRDVRGRDYAAPRILFVGKAFERKGGPGLLRAFAKVRREIPDAELTIIGPELSDLPPGVRCLRFLSKSNPSELETILDEYARASVFVLPSLYEPYGVVFAEAMAHRLPCVGTAHCAIPEIVLDGRTGFTVPVGDDAALADRLIGLLRDPEACRQLGDAGYEKYTTDHTWAAVTGKMCEAIGSVV